MRFYGVVVLLMLVGCATPAHQTQYNAREVGISTIVEFGTVVRTRTIDIQREDSGTGALAGAALGASGGANVGSGNGQLAAVVGGAVVGAAAGALAEQALSHSQGLEYTITKEDGITVTVAQNVGAKDVVFNAGDRVMIQTSGSYQRVLPANDLPESIKRPKGIKVTD